MTIRVRPVDRPELTPLVMSDRFRTEIAYFMSLPGEAGVPTLAAGEYWISAPQAKTWLDEGVFRLVSPLDSDSQAEIELSEEQEAWLEWMTANGIERVRLET
jgi:hypothetical protein